jgi:hypothetical protein
MEEDQYRAVYGEINPRRCVFEKAINSRVCGCSKAHRFNLADREGVACRSDSAQQTCQRCLHGLRRNARFALGLTRAEGPLPHSAEIRVQNGGLLGLQGLLDMGPDEAATVGDIHAVVAAALQRFGAVDALPYDRIVPSVVHYQGRRRSRR